MLEWFGELLSKFGANIVEKLPQSPVARYIDAVEELPFLSFLNWFIPVTEILIVCQTWLACISCYYLFSLILRWIKAIS